jgi:hypothetical protein
MKKIIITALLALVALTMTGQDRLIRVDSESTAWRKKDPQVVLFDQEKARLLMPQGTAFGVECVPSFSPEWTLTYDSIAHTLVFKIAEKSIWYSTYGAWHKSKKVGKNQSESMMRKRPKNYVAPDVKTYSLSITSEQVQQLRAIWTTAVSTAEDREVFILDGTKWEYFIDGRRAKSHHEKSVLVKFTNELAEAIRTGNVSRIDSLFAESQKVITGLTTPPPPEVLEPGTVRRLIVINDKPLADSTGFVSDLGIDELVYFNRRQQSIRSVSFIREEEPKKLYSEKYGVKVKDMVVEYKTGPDTHCDAYVREHPELMQTLRYVEGYVLDDEEKPVADAWVYVEGRSRMADGVATDSTGHFAFWISPTDTMLTASKGPNWVNKIPIIDVPITIRIIPIAKRKEHNKE